MLALTLGGATVLDSIREPPSSFSDGSLEQSEFPRNQDKGVQHDEGCLLSASAIGV